MALIEINWNPSSRELRQFAGLWVAFCALVGVLLIYQAGWWIAAGVLWGLGVVVGGIGLVRPPFIRPLYLGWMKAAYPIGWLLAHLLLAVVYYGLMTPVGLLMRLFGYDPMHRRFDRAAATYWVAHNPGGDTARYFRQL